MWTPTTREQHNRKAPRYQTDLTDAEWAVIEPHLPPARGTGRPRLWPMREIVNGIFYVMRAGCPLRPFGSPDLECASRPLRHLLGPSRRTRWVPPVVALRLSSQ